MNQPPHEPKPLRPPMAAADRPSTIAFCRFMAGLRADARLGRYVSPLAGQTPEVVVMALTMALADASEGNALRPAIALLERMEAR